MKRFAAVCIILTLYLCTLSATAGHCEDVKQARHWYRLEIQTGEATYQCIGSSILDEKEFAKQFAGSEFIVLDDVAYVDPTGKIKGWQEWDTKAFPRLYVNPEYIIFFNPMKGDPRKPSTIK